MRTAKIAYVCTDPGVPVFGNKGCSIHVQSMLRQMLATGADVSLFARRFGGDVPQEFDSLNIHELPAVRTRLTAEREQSLAAANRNLSIQLAAAAPFDLVYERYALWSHATMQFAADSRIPSVLEINAPLVQEQAKHRELIDVELAQSITEKAFREAQVLLAVSQGVVERLRNSGSITIDRRIEVVPNGVTPQRFDEARREVWQRLNAIPQSDEPFVVGFVGTLRPWHGLATLGAAFTLLHKQLPAAKLLVVGDGAARDELESNLSPAAASATTVTGAVSHADVPDFMAKMDVAVAPYHATDDFYFSPLKVLEYFAAGLPLVCSHASTFDGLAHDSNALFFDPQDPVELASQLKRLYDDRSLRLALARAGFDSIKLSNTWAGVCQQVLDLAGLALSQPTRSAG